MCIVLLTTAHPKYALVVLDNRDEYILRPTSRPHWWTAKPERHIASASANGSKRSTESNEVEVLSSRDLQRAERGTWLGITKGGNFAVLTNYRETDTRDAAHPVAAQRSRGGMVTAWLAADPAESTEQFVHRMLDDGGVKGVGGFSLICGKLRRVGREKNIEPLAIISNRCDHAGQVPWICGERGSLYGLSNATYLEPSERNRELLWPKIRNGVDLLNDAVAAAAGESSEEEFVASLFNILDTENFPSDHTIDLEEGIPLLKDSIFIPAFGGKEHQQEMSDAQQRGNVKQKSPNSEAAETLTITARPDESPNGFQTGLYGTQRQTVILVDWDGNVRYTERALWDCNGNPVPRGEGDQTFEFRIEGWEQEAESCN
ncbi:NRDE protein-domain-containing protein [Achaetomium macrosporum]|uniref:NRDE protein-domain-containing protein n=1 Tax=Achaetomium macrosporum TaxID=79813 RepID=A0AAN7H964_9PEZI|nr:NRDE protein-domain-containing protein [Achaetomium macrosporum]